MNILFIIASFSRISDLVPLAPGLAPTAPQQQHLLPSSLSCPPQLAGVVVVLVKESRSSSGEEAVAVAVAVVVGY
jgi:hypothetical protein